MTRSSRTVGLILDRINDTQGAVAITVENSGSVFQTELIRNLIELQVVRSLHMTRVTSFGIFIDASRDLVFVGRKPYNTRLVEDSYRFNSRLRTNRRDDLMNLVTPVVHHSVAGAAFDDIGDAIPGSVRRLFEVLPLQRNNLVSEDGEDSNHATDQADG